MTDTMSMGEFSQHRALDDLKMRVAMCDLFYKQQCSTNYYLEELALIQDQNELMEQIKENMSSRRMGASMCKEDRETTRDADTTQLSQVRSTGAMLTVTSPTNSSFISTRNSFFRRGSAIQPTDLRQLILQVEERCSGQARQLLERLINENKRIKEQDREIKKLKAQLAKANQEIDQIKVREIAAEAKLYDANKRLQNYEASASDFRRKREDYFTKLKEIEQKQIQTNKFEISLMVREKISRTQTTSLTNWSRSIHKYQLNIESLTNLIEKVIATPSACSYRQLADTVIRSLQAQQSDLNHQIQILNDLELKQETMFKSLKRSNQ